MLMGGFLQGVVVLIPSQIKAHMFSQNRETSFRKLNIEREIRAPKQFR